MKKDGSNKPAPPPSKAVPEDKPPSLPPIKLPVVKFDPNFGNGQGINPIGGLIPSPAPAPGNSTIIDPVMQGIADQANGVTGVAASVAGAVSAGVGNGASGGVGASSGDAGADGSTSGTAGVAGAAAGVAGAVSAAAGGDGSAAAGDGGCFVAGTLVTSGNSGLVPIEELEIGDWVTARPEDDGESAPQRVTRRWKHEDRATVRMHLENGEMIRTTRTHRFYAEGKGFVGVEQLAPGDLVRTLARESIGIASIAAETDKTTVYNLSIDRFPTYFVGRSGVWVHNVKTTGDDGASSFGGGVGTKKSGENQ